MGQQLCPEGAIRGSAALAVAGLTQALITFDFTPPPECAEDAEGTVHIVSKMRGPVNPEVRLAGPPVIDVTLPYVVDADGRLEIRAEGGVFIEGFVGLVEPAAEADAPGNLPQPAGSSLNSSKSNVNVFVFTAGDFGDPNIGFSGAAFTSVRSGKSNSDN